MTRARSLAVLAFSLGALVATPARADVLQASAGVAQDLPEQPGMVAPPPPTSSLPDFAHGRTELALDGAMTNAASSERGSSGTTIGLLFASGEAPLGALGRFYVGARMPFAAATVAGGGAKAAAGNLEAHARLVFPLPAWLAFGASLGVTAPTAQFDQGTSAQEAAAAASSIEPTELALFSPHSLAFRPALDLRVLRGPFVVQLRDGADFLTDTTRASFGMAGRIVAHAGVMPARGVELSVEASHVYFFTSGDAFGVDVSDAKRTALTLGPFVRIGFRDVDLGVGATTNIQAPLSSHLDRFVALRLSLVSRPF